MDWGNIYIYFGIFAVTWLIAYPVYQWLFGGKIEKRYKAIIESYRYEVDIVNDHYEKLRLEKAEQDQQFEIILKQNREISASLEKRQLHLIEKENELKRLSSQGGDIDGKIEGLRQEVFRKTEQIDVLHRQLQQKSSQLEHFEKEIDSQKTLVAQLQLKAGENSNNALLIEKNKQIALLHTELSHLLPLESKVVEQTSQLAELTLQKENLKEILSDKDNEIERLLKDCESCKEEVEKLKADDEAEKLRIRIDEQEELISDLKIKASQRDEEIAQINALITENADLRANTENYTRRILDLESEIEELEKKSERIELSNAAETVQFAEGREEDSAKNEESKIIGFFSIEESPKDESNDLIEIDDIYTDDQAPLEIDAEDILESDIPLPGIIANEAASGVDQTENENPEDTNSIKIDYNNKEIIIDEASDESGAEEGNQINKEEVIMARNDIEINKEKEEIIEEEASIKSGAGNAAFLAETIDSKEEEEKFMKTPSELETGNNTAAGKGKKKKAAKLERVMDEEIEEIKPTKGKAEDKEEVEALEKGKKTKAKRDDYEPEEEEEEIPAGGKKSKKKNEAKGPVSEIESPEDEELDEEAKKREDPIFKELAAPKMPVLGRQNRLFLQMQSPKRIFFYWQVKDNPFKTLSKAFGDSAHNYTLVAKLKNLSRDSEDMFPIDTEGSAWFDVADNTKYQSEIGFYAPNRPFVRIAFSNTLKTPRMAPSPNQDDSPVWNISSLQFAEVLEASGYGQDAFEVAMQGDGGGSGDSPAAGAGVIFARISGEPESKFAGFDPNELRSVLLAIAAGVPLNVIMESVSGELSAWLSENPEALDPKNVMPILQELFGDNFGKFVEGAESETRGVVFGASSINFPKALWKVMPISSGKAGK